MLQSLRQSKIIEKFFKKLFYLVGSHHKHEMNYLPEFPFHLVTFASYLQSFSFLIYQCNVEHSFDNTELLPGQALPGSRGLCFA